MKRFRSWAAAVIVTAGLAVTATPAFAAARFDVSAHTSFKRVHTWKVEKTVRTSEVTLDIGATTDVNYDVTVTNIGAVDSDWQVLDGIHYYGTTFTATAVVAVIQPGNISATVICPPGKFGIPIRDLNCTYSANLPSGGPHTTYATVMFADGTSATQSFAFDFTVDLLPGQPVTSQTSVNVSDSFAGDLGTVTLAESPKSFTYSRTIGPYADCGDHSVDNTASLNDAAGSSASASVIAHVTCPPPAVFDLSAHTAFDRAHTWKVEKTARTPEVTLAIGGSTGVTYDVTVSRTGAVDSNWRVLDGIHYYGPTFTATSVEAVIQPGNITATVICPPGKLGAPIRDLNCTYSASLPDGSPRTVWATVTFADGSTTTQSFAFDFTSDLLTGQPAESQTSVDVSDSLAGALGTVTLAESPKTFTYSRTIGPYATCGDHKVDNTASLNDAAGSTSSASVIAHVTCPPPSNGCTRTIGYWKNHAGFGPQADVVTQYLPISLGDGKSKTRVVSTAALAVQYLEMRGSNNVKQASNGINKLYAQLLAAKLNGASGASTSAVASTIAASDAFLGSNDSLSWSSLGKSTQRTVNGWMTTLDDYNNGLIGPRHCD